MIPFLILSQGKIKNGFVSQVINIYFSDTGTKDECIYLCIDFFSFLRTEQKFICNSVNISVLIASLCRFIVLHVPGPYECCLCSAVCWSTVYYTISPDTLTSTDPSLKGTVKFIFNPFEEFFNVNHDKFNEFIVENKEVFRGNNDNLGELIAENHEIYILINASMTLHP